MASSALYRYFKSRDELLTRLIIDAYDSLGAAAEVRGGNDRPERPGRPLRRDLLRGPGLGAGPPE